jgi:hypothetical protein
MKDNRGRLMVDAAIAHAVASLRDVVARLEAGPRQRAAEVLMHAGSAIEELSREAARLLPVGDRGRVRSWRHP